NGTGRLWDAGTGRAIGAPLPLGVGCCTCTLFSADGRRLLSVGRDGTARIWDPTTGRPLTPAVHQGSVVVQAALSPDGDRFATAAGDGSVRVWDAQRASLLSSPVKQAGVTCL